MINNNNNMKNDEKWKKQSYETFSWIFESLQVKQIIAFSSYVNIIYICIFWLNQSYPPCAISSRETWAKMGFLYQ